MPLQYPFPWKIGLLLLRDALLLRQRNFREDNLEIVKLLHPLPNILNKDNIPNSGPALLVTNHYSHPGFPAWWIAIGITASVPLDIHWLMTAGWTHLKGLQTLTRWFFPRVAQVYGITATPPMPPKPEETESRAKAVRQALRYARQSPAPVIGLALEGRDHPGGILAPPPPGAGRFVGKLASHCKRIVPIGVYEDKESLCVNFGPSSKLKIPPGLSADQRDRTVSKLVMRAIAQQLPPALRGEYGNSSS
ncbi:MAG: 1-acyl-sn-glycerol-3-phosphate acyltransferase [Anaerolineales bacterium]|nr:1-acyl-sn-glycerol-3-phosphate acyltransferase [Chloroflexota bacterium]MBL6982837.1 1-acyl-sn-glycerol-3-phosphate acyltransferase [Anaerolineales bacterium]